MQTGNAWCVIHHHLLDGLGVNTMAGDALNRTDFGRPAVRPLTEKSIVNLFLNKNRMVSYYKI